MRPIRAMVFAALLLCLLAPAGAAEEAGLSFGTVPDVLRPGKYYEFIIASPAGGNATLSLLDSAGVVSHSIYADYPLQAGDNHLYWDGTENGQTPVAQGEYTLRLSMNGQSIDSGLRIGAPYPMLTDISQSDYIVTEDLLTVSFTASMEGTVLAQLKSFADNTTTDIEAFTVRQGANSFQWRGRIGGERVPDGDYALILTLQAAGGADSMAQHIYIEVQSPQAQEETSGIRMADATPTPAPTPTPVPASKAYSAVDDGTFWSMTPGELDDSVIWDILMQPITVYDGGIKAGVKGHAYLMENPDGTGAQVAQLHTQSQGVHVIGEPNEYGYVLVEAFSNYDRDYYPATEEEQARAFELKQGYVLAEHLKTVEVMTDMALLIDKLTQRMYLFIDGERVTEFLISTGTWSKAEDMLFETVPGEFITVSHTGSLVDGNMTSDMAIRINGGILIHEVPHKTRDDGTKVYASFEAYLGTKQSHGCIRVQRLKNEEGYNHRWIWENFKRTQPYKVIIWDDQNRVDTPGTWYPNP